MNLQIPLPTGFDFQECVNAHGWKSLAPFTWDADLKILSRVEQFAGQAPDLVRMSSSGSALIVEIDGTVPEVAARRLVERMFQLDIAMGDFHDYCKETDKLKHVPNSCQGRMLRSPTLYEDVLKVISTTNTTWAQTKAMVWRVATISDRRCPPIRRFERSQPPSS